MVQAINTITNKQGQKSNAYFSVPATLLPEGERNYCLFNQGKVSFIVSQKENALPYLKKILETSNDEKEIVETLYIINRMIDKDTKGIPAMYPVFAKFNDTKSQNIQAFLAGIYRKTQVPDAFGPLVKMLTQNSNNPNPTTANEEVGGAILAYIENYSHNPSKIDYTA